VIEEIQLDLAAAQSKFGKESINAKNVGKSKFYNHLMFD
jgi:hypothetical protein